MFSRLLCKIIIVVQNFISYREFIVTHNDNKHLLQCRIFSQYRKNAFAL